MERLGIETDVIAVFEKERNFPQLYQLGTEQGTGKRYRVKSVGTVQSIQKNN